MNLSNDIVLRPRFQFLVNENDQVIMEVFANAKKTQKSYIVSVVDAHVFIKIPKDKQHFWSPQLHLEVIKSESKHNSLIRGLFGPNPTVWTLFMFLHFLVACLFLGFGIWAYTNWSLNNNYTLPLGICFFTILLWFVLYFAGRLGKKAGNKQMHELHGFMRDTLQREHIHSVS